MNCLFIGLINNNPVQEILSDNITGNGKIIKYNNNNIISIYTGKIVNGKMEDDKGILNFIVDSNVFKYIGGFTNDLYDGYGELFYKNYDIYRGLFKNGLKHGLGKLFNKENIIIIDNIWFNDVVAGKLDYINYYQSGNKEVEGILNNNIRRNLWIYYNDSKVKSISKLEFYSNESENELLESFLNIKDKYIDKQLFLLKKYPLNLSDIQDINFNNYKIANIANINSLDINELNALKPYSIPINNDQLFYTVSKNKDKLIDCIYINENNEERIYVKFIHEYNKLIFFDDQYIHDICSIYQNNYLIYRGFVNKYFEYHGFGTLYNDFSNIKFEGTFNNNSYEKGKLYKDGYLHYDGEFFENKITGEGKLYDRNVLIYEGFLVDGRRTNFGISYHSNGAREYEGMWDKDLKHGNGRLYDVAGILICVCTHEYNNLITVI